MRLSRGGIQKGEFWMVILAVHFFSREKFAHSTIG
jgi:hypothetical protein